MTQLTVGNGPLDRFLIITVHPNSKRLDRARRANLFLGKEEVSGSNPDVGSSTHLRPAPTLLQLLGVETLEEARGRLSSAR